MSFVVSASTSVPNKLRRTLEKKRIQQLKLWHEDVKKIAKAETVFFGKIFGSIFQDDKNSEDRDWIRDDESDDEPEEGGKLVKTDS